MISEARIQASKLRGIHKIPPSKSQTMRKFTFASLAKGRTLIHNYPHSPDTTAIIDARRLMGAEIKVMDEILEIEGNLTPAQDVINAGNSGLVFAIHWCNQCTDLSIYYHQQAIIRSGAAVL